MIYLSSVKCIRRFILVFDLTKRSILGVILICFSSTFALADKALYPQWAIAVANEKCKLWEKYGYDYYEVRKYMNVQWSPEFDKQFSLLPYQKAIKLSRDVTGSICKDLQEEAWERFRDKQVDSDERDDLKEQMSYLD